jgi:hypothetical protein
MSAQEISLRQASYLSSGYPTGTANTPLAILLRIIYTNIIDNIDYMKNRELRLKSFDFLYCVHETKLSAASHAAADISFGA